ncbi:uncharacterized protein LOC135805665 [Sycon ciliatum]|uniref:uncharacterized protein LOC135805665 n=1 Tax=Sycon ciliatum TaxID=27933 RepID=UPI0020AE6458
MASVIADTIRSKLEAGLSPTHLDIKDTSGGCGSAFEVVVVSAQFAGLNTLKRHRLVNSLLSAELETVHAFSQSTYTPEQWAEKQAS